MSDIVEKLRERPYRLATETEDQAKLRRQAERERAANEIERLQREITYLKGLVDGYKQPARS